MLHSLLRTLLKSSAVRALREELPFVLEMCGAVCSVSLFLRFRFFQGSPTGISIDEGFFTTVAIGLVVSLVYSFCIFHFHQKNRNGKSESTRRLVLFHRPVYGLLAYPLLPLLTVESLFYVSIVAGFYATCLALNSSLNRSAVQTTMKAQFSDDLAGLEARNTLTIFLIGIIGTSLSCFVLLLGFSELYHPDPSYFLEIGRSMIKPEVLTAAAPEPQERALYVLGCALLLPLAAIWHVLLKKLFRRVVGRLSYNLFLVTLVVFVFAIGCFTIKGFSSTSFNYLQSSILTRYIWVYLLVVMPFILSLVFLSEKHQDTFGKRSGVISLVAVALLVVLPLYFSNIFSYNTYSGPNLNATIYSISQVVQGKSIFVDLFSQYGFYPHFLEPVFRIIGFSVLKFSMVMSLINVVAFSLAILALKKLVRNPIIFFLTAIAFVYITFFLVQVTFERMIYYAIGR